MGSFWVIWSRTVEIAWMNYLDLGETTAKHLNHIGGVTFGNLTPTTEKLNPNTRNLPKTACETCDKPEDVSRSHIDWG